MIHRNLPKYPRLGYLLCEIISQYSSIILITQSRGNLSRIYTGWIIQLIVFLYRNLLPVSNRKCKNKGLDRADIERVTTKLVTSVISEIFSYNFYLQFAHILLPSITNEWKVREDLGG